MGAKLPGVEIARQTGVRVHYEVMRAPIAREFVLKLFVSWVRVYS